MELVGSYYYFTDYAERGVEIETVNLSPVDRDELEVVYDNCVKYADTLETYMNDLNRLLEKDLAL